MDQTYDTFRRMSVEEILQSNRVCNEEVIRHFWVGINQLIYRHDGIELKLTTEIYNKWHKQDRKMCNIVERPCKDNVKNYYTTPSPSWLKGRSQEVRQLWDHFYNETKWAGEWVSFVREIKKAPHHLYYIFLFTQYL